MIILRTPFILLLLILLPQLSLAENANPDYFELAVNDEVSISISKFGNDGDRILWIPTEHGVREKHKQLLGSLAALHHEVWLSNLHESYFLSSGRTSYTEIPVEDISTLIEKSIPDNNRKLFIVSTGRGATLALMALNDWQKKTTKAEKLGGLIMLQPKLRADTPSPGEGMTYLPIVDATQLPIYIIQPKKSEKYWYLSNLTNKLTESGSYVFTQVIDQVGDGYHVRRDVSDIEEKKAKQLPAQISAATRLLAKKQVIVKNTQATNNRWKLAAVPELMQAYPDNTAAPKLKLTDTKGITHDLSSHKGKVVVLNFWATWCPPCVEEIPSLGRLQKTFSKNDLLVLSVDIGESKTEVEAFLKQVPAQFPVLLDPEGNTVKRWKITAFPTTFVINKQGVIELSYYGGMEWDKPEIVKQLQAVIAN